MQEGREGRSSDGAAYWRAIADAGHRDDVARSEGAQASDTQPRPQTSLEAPPAIGGAPSIPPDGWIYHTWTGELTHDGEHVAEGYEALQVREAGQAPTSVRAFGDAGDIQDTAATPLGTVPTAVRDAVTQSADHRLKIRS